ncbi:WbqC-like protein family protein [Mesonia phycicola]|uniref:WbqC-like protein family protein n=1 Tax=Mesonia phycicola TaxID=579105 RepID=A0A1M6FLJ8_9FLAO|nr:WbqC family protein [Mesonia phycicola]SHI98598.1 WbqC-like protein family protein [Mesonia phycicola]
MKTVLLHPAYFGTIFQFCHIAQAEEILFENEDNYQKQTYRTRQYIYGANGSLLLNIPIKHTGNKEKKQKYKDVKIEQQFNWQTIHWRSLEAAYRTSPFFEFYEDELIQLYQKEYNFLLDFNYACFQATVDCLQIDIPHQKTTEYFTEDLPKEITDQRKLINAKGLKKPLLENYTQVFEEKHGFLPNLSILDLLFNEGPNSLNYLENQNLE